MRKLILFLFIALSISTAFCAASRSFTNTAGENISMGNVNDTKTNDFTMLVWKRSREDSSSDAWITKKRTTVTNAGKAYFDNASDNATAIVSDNTNTLTCSSIRDLDDAWAHEAVTWDGTANTLRLIENLNVACSSTGVSMGSLSTTFGFYIGNSGVLSEQANGQAAHVAFYPSVLTLAQISELYFKPETPFSGVSGYWPLWFEGSTEKDLSGRGLTGTVTTTTSSNDGPPVMFGSGLPL